MNIVVKAHNILRLVPAFRSFGLINAVDMAMQVNRLIENNLPILNEEVETVDCIVLELESKVPFALLPAPKDEP